MKKALRAEIKEMIKEVVRDEIPFAIGEEVRRQRENFERHDKNHLGKCRHLLEEFKKDVATEHFLDVLVGRINKKQIR
jgi:hypothetical protein